MTIVTSVIVMILILIIILNILVNLIVEEHLLRVVPAGGRFKRRSSTRCLMWKLLNAGDRHLPPLLLAVVTAGQLVSSAGVLASCENRPFGTQSCLVLAV